METLCVSGIAVHTTDTVLRKSLPLPFPFPTPPYPISSCHREGVSQTLTQTRAWHIEPSSYPSTQKGGYLNAPVSICSGRTYTITFYARTESTNPDPLNPGCFATISTLLQGEIGGVRIAGSSMRPYGSWTYTPTVEPVNNGVGREGSVYRERGEDFEGRGWKGWGWNDTLSIYMRCENSPVPILAEIDSVMIV